MERLGTVLAVAGWGLVALMVVFLVGAVMEGGLTAIAMVIPLSMSVIGALVVAATGHILRALAQLGRNVHRLATLVQRP